MSIEREFRDLKKRLNSVESQLSKIPSRIGSSVGGAGSGNQESVFFDVDNYASLPEATDEYRHKLARINSGDYMGGIAYAFKKSDEEWEWHMLTHLM